MNLRNDMIPQGSVLKDVQPPADRETEGRAEQAPLGPRPTYDELLDTAVDYTFPCSDPIAAGACRDNPAKP